MIDFVSNYFNIGLKDAALKIADDFGIDIADSECTDDYNFWHPPM